GSPDPVRGPLDTLGKVREAELDRCLAVPGVTEHRWLDYPDGACADVPEDEPVARIASLMRELRPDTVLTFGPEGMTGHPDHQAVCRWTTRAFADVAQAGRRLWAPQSTGGA